MFIIGGSNDHSEVFDSITRKFTYIKTIPNLSWHIRVDNPFQVVDIADKIYFFRMYNNKVKVYIYDVRKNLFTFKTSIEMRNFDLVSCIKVPMI